MQILFELKLANQKIKPGVTLKTGGIA